MFICIWNFGFNILFCMYIHECVRIKTRILVCLGKNATKTFVFAKTNTQSRNKNFYSHTPIYTGVKTSTYHFALIYIFPSFFFGAQPPLYTLILRATKKKRYCGDLNWFKYIFCIWTEVHKNAILVLISTNVREVKKVSEVNLKPLAFQIIFHLFEVDKLN